MSQGYYQQHPAKAPVIAWDAAISIVSLVLTAFLGGIAMLFGVFSLAFLDYCPPESCSADGAATAVGAALAALLIVASAGGIWAIVWIVRRKISWPISVATLVICALICVFGGLGYAGAVS